MRHLLLICFAATMLNAFGQRASTKDFRIEVIERPTVPEELVRNVSFRIHVPDVVFNLEGLRLFGKAMDEMKTDGERLSSMKFFTIGEEVEVVEEWPTLVVDIAMGAFTASPPRINATPIAKDSEENRYTAQLSCNWPMQVMIRDVEGTLLDAYAVAGDRTISFGNEEYTKIESKRAGFSYEKGKWDFRSESDLRAELSSGDGVPRVMWKMFLNQFSDAIDELEMRLFFIETKRSIEIATAKGRKFDYDELDDAQEAAKGLFDAGDFDGLSQPMEVWQRWLDKADYMNPKAEVNQPIAVELMLNLAQAHLYREEWTECAVLLGNARKYITPLGDLNARIDRLNAQLERRRKADLANGDRLPGEDEKTHKAVDFKNLIAKRSQNKDVKLFFDADLFAEFAAEQQRWEAALFADAPEKLAESSAEMTMEDRLGQRITQVVGGVGLGLVGLMDADLVGGPFPEEIFAVDRLVNLSLNGMQFGAIPEGISRLGMLQVLDLTDNGLTSLPHGMGELGALKRLVLRNNQLTDLPASLANCTELKVVDLRGNPFPAEKVAQWQALLPEKCKLKID